MVHGGMEAQHTFSRLACRLSIRTKQTMSRVVTDPYGRLNMSLVKANSRAILSRTLVVQCSCVIGCTLNIV